jgi:hypothetical protein
MILTILAVVVIALVAFVVWRYTSVSRGANARDRALLQRLDPLAARFESTDKVTAEEVEKFGASPELRPMLYAMLTHYQVTELFPPAYLSQQAQAESTLVYWMLHPNELQAAPASIELLEKVERQFAGRAATFYVFQYRMPEGHWAGTQWSLGLAGPFTADDKPYQAAAGGFSRGEDKPGKVAPAELVDWYIGILNR